MLRSSPAEPDTIAPSAMLATLAALAGTRFSSFNEAVEAYLSAAARLSGVRSAFISQLDGQTLEMLGTWSNGGCRLPSDGAHPLEEVPCQYVRAEAGPVMIGDTAHDPRVRNLPVLQTLEIGSYLGVPLLRHDGVVIGSFCMVDPDPHNFSDDQANALVVLAQQLVQLVERELAERRAVQVERETAEDLGAALSALDGGALLLRTVAHDLRTPLTSVRGYADLIASGVLGAVSEGQAAALGKIGGAAKFMRRLTDDLLDLGQADGGSLLLASEPYQPEALARLVYELSAGHAAERGLELRVEAAGELPEAIGDPTRVQQILLNLVSNALSYSPEGAVTLRAAAREGRIEYSVIDNGPGIPPEALPHIWQLGWRGGGGRGTGLGLYLARRLAEAMGGDVAVESAPGAGCTFTLRLPLAVERPVRASLG